MADAARWDADRRHRDRHREHHPDRRHQGRRRDGDHRDEHRPGRSRRAAVHRAWHHRVRPGRQDRRCAVRWERSCADQYQPDGGLPGERCPGAAESADRKETEAYRAAAEWGDLWATLAGAPGVAVRWSLHPNRR